MRFLRLGDPGAEHPAVIDDEGTLYDLSLIAHDIDGEFFAEGGVMRTRQALEAGGLPHFEEQMEGVALPDLGEHPRRIGPPIARPGAVVCIGQNYAAHAAESGSPPPKEPIIFLKHPNTVVGPYDDVRIPKGSEKTDWEVELGVVIGRTARYLGSPEEAIDHIAGYVVSNDVSERTFQIENSGGQWSKGKCAETFNPVGPWLVPADGLDPGNLTLRSYVNGEIRQDSTTADMIFDVNFLIWHLSQFLVLEPGDLVNTGTPQGVALSGRFPFLAPGDVMQMEIEGLGRQRQRLVDFAGDGDDG